MIEAALQPLPTTFVEGGGGGKSGSSQFHEDPNTLRSAGMARVLDLISEGEIRGLVNESKSIFLDDTPIENEDGTMNFTGVSWAIVHGLPDQPYLPGFTSVVQPVATFASAIDLKYNETITRRITDADVSAAIVTINVPALNLAASDGSKLSGSTVTHTITVTNRADQVDATTYTAVVHTISGKCMSPYEEDYRIQLAEGEGPWDIHVTRNTADSQDVKLVNASQWSRFQTAYDHKFTYPYSAMIGLEVNSEYFGTSIPTRAYEIYGLIIQVPSNYDPLTRRYTGLWDGTFKWAWTNNPAWVFYDLCVNARYGANVNPKYVDKWALYQIAQYCDAVVDDGNGNMVFQGVPDGGGGMEPRFTYNGVLNKQEDTYKVLTSLASAFRGMAYWGAGLVTAVADQPTDAIKIFTPANVLNGDFEYSGSAKKARHTVCIVGWNNPLNGYTIDYEVVDDHDGVLRYGMRSTDLQAVGCTSRGQARRTGRWLLATEMLETDTVKFTTGFDGADLNPGQLIMIADPNYAGVRMGGRLLEVGANSVRMDAVFNFLAGEEYQISMMTPQGEVITLDVGNPPGASDTINLVTPIAEGAEPVIGAIFALSEVGNVEPRPFRVLAVAEADHGQYQVLALQYNPLKYDIADNGADFDDNPQNTFQKLPVSSKCQPPANLNLKLESVVRGYGLQSLLTAHWDPSTDALLQGYMVSYRAGHDNFVQLPLQTSTSFSLDNPVHDIYEFRVYAINRFGIPSQIIAGTLDLTAAGQAGGMTLVSGLDTVSKNGNFEGRDVTLNWLASPLSNPTMAADSKSFRDDFFDGFRVRVYDMTSGLKVREDFVYQPTYSYTYDMNLKDGGPRRTFQVRVAIRAKDGSFTNEAVLTVQNPAPLMQNLTLQPLASSVAFYYSQPTDPDFGGIKIWMATAPFTPNDDTNLVWTGLGTPIVGVTPNTTYYFTYEFQDAFGPSGTRSAQASFTSGKLAVADLDTTPPPDLAKPTMASTLNIDVAGNPSVDVSASWTASASPDISGYDIEITLGTGTPAAPVWGQPSVYTTPDIKYTWNKLSPGLLARSRVRPFDRTGNRANWSPYSDTLTLAKDAVAPGLATNVLATASFKAVFLSWTNPADIDLAAVQIWGATTNNSANATVITTVNAIPSNGGGYTHSGLVTGTTYYYWLKTVDSSGNASAFSAVASATAAQVPTVELTGLITQTQITDGSISTSKIAANAVDATKIASNTITANQIAAGTITANEIKVGTITSDRIQAGTIAGDRISTTTSLPGTITVGTTGVSIATIQSGVAGATAGGNLIPNSDYKAGLSGWLYFNSNGSAVTTTSFGNGVSAETPYMNLTFTATAAGSTVSIYEDPANRHPVTAGKRYAVSCMTGGNSLSSQSLVVWWYKSDGTASATPSTTVATRAGTGGWPNQIGGFANAPGDAYSGRIELYGNVLVGTGVLSLGNPFMAEVATGCTTLPSYTVGPVINPAAMINQQTTQIQPGLIQISGATTLANWRNGTDSTKIEGGSIAANTVTANKLKIGDRGISIIGCEFQYIAASGTLAWNSGYVLWTDDNGNQQASQIAAGSTTFLNGTWTYVYWAKGAGTLTATNDWGGAKAGDNVLFTSWTGGASFVATYGGTIVDGSRITTGSVTADRLQVTSLSAVSGTIGLLRTAATGARTEIQDNLIRVYDANNVLRVQMGVW